MTQNPSIAKTEQGASGGYPRPTTLGELRDRLRRGETCEVVADNAETTSMLLRGWLRFEGFIVRPSSDGWALFEPTTATPGDKP